MTTINIDELASQYEYLNRPACMIVPVNPVPGVEGDYVHQDGQVVTAINRTRPAETYCSGIQVLNPTAVKRLAPVEGDFRGRPGTNSSQWERCGHRVRIPTSGCRSTPSTPSERLSRGSSAGTPGGTLARNQVQFGRGQRPLRPWRALDSVETIRRDSTSGCDELISLLEDHTPNPIESVPQGPQVVDAQAVHLGAMGGQEDRRPRIDNIDSAPWRAAYSPPSISILMTAGGRASPVRTNASRATD